MKNANESENDKGGEGLNDYLKSSRVTALLHSMFKSVLLDQPENPIEYLQHFLRNEAKQHVSVIFPDSFEEHSICKTIAERNNWNYLAKSEIFANNGANDHQIYNLSKDRYQSFDKTDSFFSEIEETDNQRSWIFEGIPKSSAEAYSFRLHGIFLDRIIAIILKNHKEPDLKEGSEVKLKKDINTHNAHKYRYLEELNKIVKVEILELKSDMSQEEMILSIQSKIFSPSIYMTDNLEPPKFCIIGFPNDLVTSQSNRIARKLDIPVINKRNILKRLKAKHSLQSLSPDKEDLDQFEEVLKRLEESDCKSRGWIVEGYPAGPGHVSALYNTGNLPNSIIIIKEDNHKEIVFTCYSRQLSEREEIYELKENQVINEDGVEIDFLSDGVVQDLCDYNNLTKIFFQKYNKKQMKESEIEAQLDEIIMKSLSV